MEASLGVPTATSVRVVPAKLLEVNRTIVNNQLVRTTGREGQLHPPHRLRRGQGAPAVPAMNAAFVADADGKGTPGVDPPRARRAWAWPSTSRSRAGRTLLVPCIADADTLDFRGFVAAYEELVRKIHTNKIAPDDFAGTTVTLTNPGTLGTVQSVPRLMPGQGLIVGVGALGFPPGFEAADPRNLAELGIGKTVTLTSTYDHRIIQGAESGLFLAYVSECLMGEHGFYHEVFESLEIPYEPVRWQKDVNASDDEGEGAHLRLIKQVHVQTLINMYRVRGHLIAHLDPLDAEQPELHPELDPLHYGLTIWDLPRPLRGRRPGRQGRGHPRRDPPPPARRLLPDPRRGVHAHPGPRPEALDPAAPRRGVRRRGARTSSVTSWTGSTRPRCSSGSSTRATWARSGSGSRGPSRPSCSSTPSSTRRSNEGLHEAVMGMSHRGRLNVLANIVGKSYGEIFEEFEGNLDPESVQGSGDVKYHKGAVGTLRGPQRRHHPASPWPPTPPTSRRSTRWWWAWPGPNRTRSAASRVAGPTGGRCRGSVPGAVHPAPR